MSKPRVLFDACILAGLSYFIFADPAQAYFEMGTGTYVLQLLLGFAAALWLSSKYNFKTKAFKKKTDTTKLGNEETDVATQDVSAKQPGKSAESGSGQK